jgi:hypothetical protein
LLYEFIKTVCGYGLWFEIHKWQLDSQSNRYWITRIHVWLTVQLSFVNFEP